MGTSQVKVGKARKTQHEKDNERPKLSGKVAKTQVTHLLAQSGSEKVFFQTKYLS